MDNLFIQFSTCAAKDLRCVVNRFCRTGPVPSSDNLKRLSCESKSARDFRRPGLKSTSPFNSVKRIADEPLSAAKTTPLVKHRSRAPWILPSTLRISPSMMLYFSQRSFIILSWALAHSCSSSSHSCTNWWLRFEMLLKILSSVASHVASGTGTSEGGHLQNRVDVPVALNWKANFPVIS